MLDPDCFCAPSRQFYAARFASVAYHDVAHQVSQLGSVLRLWPVAAGDVLAGKISSRLQLTGADQSDHVEQLGKVVLHRRGSQEEYVLLLDAVDKFPGERILVSASVSLVYHNHVKRRGHNLRDQRRRAQHQHPPDQPAHDVLHQNQPGFDRLS